MHRRLLVSLYSLLAMSIILIAVALFIGSPEVKWIVAAVGLATVSVGLGITSFVISLHAASTTSKMVSTLNQIEKTQQDILTELKREKSSSPPIVASLQAFSQFYLDYLQKQASKDAEGKKQVGDTQ